MYLRYSVGMPSKPDAFSNFNDYFFWGVTGLEFNRGAFINGSQQGVDSTPYLSLMVTVTQAMRCELVF
jgi:hypothetical protein